MHLIFGGKTSNAYNLNLGVALSLIVCMTFVILTWVLFHWFEQMAQR